MIPIIWPYKIGSSSAKALAVELETKRVYSDRNYRPRENHLIINWGNTSPANWWALNRAGGGFQCLNEPDAVVRASDKIRCLEILSEAGISIPEFYYFRHPLDDADVWAQTVFDEGQRIFCRTLTRANSGRGIVVASAPTELVAAPLYTVDVGKRREYRVHVFQGEVLDYAQKKKLSTEQLEERGIEFDKDIRSHSNGWIFARNDVDLPDPVRDIAINAVAALGLDFAAVDCYYTSQENPNPQVAGVFEVNTAPGIENTTLERYANKIKEICNES